MPRDSKSRSVTNCAAWIFVFLTLAAPTWPQTPGLIFMALSLFGVIHMGVLVYDRIHGPKYDPAMSPTDFEHYCAAILRERKWDARVTQTSGDQGIDIVAEKRGVRLVLQCKKYSKPVGNRAVQEIVAGIAHEAAQRGAVVSTNGYTRAARRLAASNNILLLNHTDLHRIDKFLNQ